MFARSHQSFSTLQVLKKVANRFAAHLPSLQLHTGRWPTYRTDALESRLLLVAPYLSFTADPFSFVNSTDIPMGMNAALPVEPVVKLNPSDPRQVVLGSQIQMRNTTLGGYNFSTVPVTFPMSSPGGDGDMAFDTQGHLYWVNIYGDAQGIQVARMNPTTGAADQQYNVSFGQFDDKPAIAADTGRASRFKDSVYVVWSRVNGDAADIYFSRLVGGFGFSAPTLLVSGNGTNFLWPADVAVAANGDVYVAYHETQFFSTLTQDSQTANGAVRVLRSTDGGFSFSSPTAALPPGTAQISYNYGGDEVDGATFFTQGSAAPVILPDPTTPGRVAIIATNNPADTSGRDDADLMMATSTNCGATWSSPTTIVSGPTITNPTTGQVTGTWQFFPQAAIDPFGDVVVAWYDNRGNQRNASQHYLVDVYAMFSGDGGRTFSAPFRVNDYAFDPDGGVNGPNHDRLVRPTGETRIGEYFGVDVFGGIAYVVWNGNTFDANTGLPDGQQVYFDRFAIAGDLTINIPSGAFDSTDTRIYEATEFFSGINVSVDSGPQFFTLDGNLHDLSVLGGYGADTIFVRAATDIGYDLIVSGGAGDDTISVLSGTRQARLYGDAGNDTIYGDNTNVNGWVTGDIIDGGDGNDMIYGYAGNDTIDGGNGNDMIDGGDGADQLYGGADDDNVFGGYGDDILHGGSGTDYLYGGEGEDGFYMYDYGGTDYAFSNDGYGTDSYLLYDYDTGHDYIDGYLL